MKKALLTYNLAPEVEAFTAGRDTALPCPVIQGHQVHGKKVAIIDSSGFTREDLEGYDAFITNLKGVAIGVRTADCVPVLLYDPATKTIAAVHAGWKGTVLNIVQEAIGVMQDCFGSNPKDLMAAPLAPKVSRSGKRWWNSSAQPASIWTESGSRWARATARLCPAATT